MASPRQGSPSTRCGTRRTSSATSPRQRRRPPRPSSRRRSLTACRSKQRLAAKRPRRLPTLPDDGNDKDNNDASRCVAPPPAHAPKATTCECLGGLLTRTAPHCITRFTTLSVSCIGRWGEPGPPFCVTPNIAGLSDLLESAPRQTCSHRTCHSECKLERALGSSAQPSVKTPGIHLPPVLGGPTNKMPIPIHPYPLTQTNSTQRPPQEGYQKKGNHKRALISMAV